MGVRVATPVGDGVEDKENFLRVKQGDVYNNRPVVVLVGCEGLKADQLIQCSKIYEKERYLTACCIPPSNTKTASDVVEFIVKEVLVKGDLTHHPLILHVFGTAGCRIYNLMVNNLGPENQLDIKGCIFDSGPARYPMWNSWIAYEEKIRNRWFPIRWILSTIFLFQASVLTASGLLTKLTSDYSVWESICYDKSRWPQLFLYSSVDDSVPCGDVEKIVDHRRSLGVKVSSKCWDDSTQFDHFALHREEYKQLCLQFVSDCLKSELPSSV